MTKLYILDVFPTFVSSWTHSNASKSNIIHNFENEGQGSLGPLNFMTDGKEDECIYHMNDKKIKNENVCLLAIWMCKSEVK